MVEKVYTCKTLHDFGLQNLEFGAQSPRLWLGGKWPRKFTLVKRCMTLETRVRPGRCRFMTPESGIWSLLLPDRRVKWPVKIIRAADTSRAIAQTPVDA